MGLFKRKKKTAVASVAYNLAGPPDGRYSFLKTLLISKVVGQNPNSFADVFVNGYLAGPGIKLKRYTSWTQSSGYETAIGWQAPTLASGSSIDQGVVAANVPHPPGSTVLIQKAQIGIADFTYWADQYMSVNYPSLIGSDYSSDYNTATGEIEVFFEAGGSVTFTPALFDVNKRYLVATYNTVATSITPDPWVYGSPSPVGSSYPSTAGWSVISLYDVTTTQSLYTTYYTENTYSDGRPSDSNTSTVLTGSITYHTINNDYERYDLEGTADTDYTYSRHRVRYDRSFGGSYVQHIDNFPTTEVIAGGVIKTTYSSEDRDIGYETRTTQVDYQDTNITNVSELMVYIYGEGNGNFVLDALFDAQANDGDYFPIIPFRIDNDFVDPTGFPTIYPLAKKALKRATSGKYDEMILNIADNPSLGDIDFAYVVFGVSLNTPEQSGREYLFRFFKAQYEAYVIGGGLFTDFVTEQDAAVASAIAYFNWKQNHLTVGHPTYDTPAPTRIPYPSLPTQELWLRANNSAINYNVRILWNFIQPETGSGLFKPDAKVGDYYVEKEDALSLEFPTFFIRGIAVAALNDQRVDVISFTHQESPTVWRRYLVGGLTSHNLIWRGKAEDINGFDALEDPDESGFLIPLNQTVYRSMGLIDGTQLSSACAYMLFNCQATKKAKWYQSTWFKVIIFVVVIAVSVAFPPAGGGLLGTAAGVGTAVGFSGLAAVIAGTVINLVAAYILIQIVTGISVQIFGKKVGAIVGAIAGVALLQVGSSLQAGQGIAASYGSLMEAQNLLLLTNAVGNGVTQYIAASTQATADKITDLNKQYAEDSRKIQEMIENAGGGAMLNGWLDPTMFTGATDFLNESPSSFLERTLLTGTDISELSLNMLSDFATITTSTTLQNQ